MSVFTIVVHFSYGDTLPQTVTTMTIKRKAKDIGSAITAVSAIFNSLSNVIITPDAGSPFPYLQVTNVGIS